MPVILLECCEHCSISQISHLSRIIGLVSGGGEIEKFEIKWKKKKKLYFLRIKGGEIKFHRFWERRGIVKNVDCGMKMSWKKKIVKVNFHFWWIKIYFSSIRARVINTNITLTHRIYNFRNSIDPSNAICPPLKLRGKLIGEDLGGKTDNDFFRILVINGFYAFGHGLVVDVTVRELKFIKVLKMHI